MKYKTRHTFLLIVFALAAVACRLSLPAQSASTPPTAALAAQTPTALPAATETALPPSQTPTATQTLYPTITPIPTITLTPTVTPLGAGPTPTPEYACQLIDKYPDNWMSFKAHSPFQGRWTLKNTGTKIWTPSEVTLEYVSGVEMYAAENFQKLTSDVEPGKLVLLIVDMISPKKSGKYITVWGLGIAHTDTILCSFTVKITVQ